MTERTTPPFRADHVGSLLRPEELKVARQRAADGEISADELHAVENTAVRDAVRMQRDAGLRSVTDGDYRRDWWHIDFLTGFDGIDTRELGERPVFQEDLNPPVMVCTGKVRRSRPVAGAAFEFLRQTVDDAGDDATAKLCIPAPGISHFRGGRAVIDEAAYPDIAAYWDDMAAAYGAEIADLGASGCGYLQLDETSFSHLCDETQRAFVRERGEDPNALLDTYVDVVNRAIAGRPAGMTVAMHTCRGNFRGQWMSQGGYETVAERFFNTIGVDALFLEYDSPRAGDFAPLRFMPADKTVVLGLVTTKTAEQEDADELKRRIDEAASYIPLERLCLSPQCGFASSGHGNPLTIDDQRRKLELIVSVAEDVWGSA